VQSLPFRILLAAALGSSSPDPAAAHVGLAFDRGPCPIPARLTCRSCACPFGFCRAKPAGPAAWAWWERELRPAFQDDVCKAWAIRWG